jgi:hypothetical protein
MRYGPKWLQTWNSAVGQPYPKAEPNFVNYR